MPAFDDLPQRLDDLRARDLYRHRRMLESPQGRQIIVDGRPLLNFCSNDYLGLAADQRLRSAFKDGVDRWGVGAGASHLVCGHTAVHHALEDALAEFVGRPRALLYANGYAANVGVINALLSRGDCVFEDRLNHASLLDGGWISRAEFHWYRHADTAHLAGKLTATAPGAGRRLVVSDGTFSMDGDLCPLARLVPLCKEQSAWLMIDDAHGIGVVGAQGQGVVDPAAYATRDVPILVGTLGKAFGCFGAFVAGDAELIDTLVQRSRNYIFTTALPPAVAAAALAALGLVKTEGWRRDKLDELIARFRSGAAQLGIDLLESATPIQPLVVGEPGRALALSRALEARGLLVGAIRPPTVPRGTSRLRVTLTAAHEVDDVDLLLSGLGDAMAEVDAAA